MVGAVAFMGDFIFDQGVVEGVDVPRGDPGLGVQQDLGIDADHIHAACDQLLPPQIADGAQQLRAQGAVIVGTGQPAVDVGGGVDEAPPLGQGDNFIQG